MTFGELVALAGNLEGFDLALLVQGLDERREAILVQLSRFMKAGKLVGLRRGMYTLPDAYRRVPLSPARLANQLYHPSYLSGLWALAAHDLIPERVVWLTSVTARPPHRFENSFGVFDYRSLKQDAFFGYAPLRYGEADALLLDKAVDGITWRITNLFPGCLMKSIDGIRAKKVTDADVIDFVKFRQLVASAELLDDAFFEQVLGKPKG